MDFFSILFNKQTSGTALVDNTVSFMADGAVYEVVSVKNGNYVSKPLTNPISPNGVFAGWLDENGNNKDFPFPPTSDMTLYALITDSQSEKLYTFFDVDKDVYPYVFVIKRGNTMGIYFTEHCTSTVIGPTNYKTHLTNNCTYDETLFPKEDDVEAVITFFINDCQLNNFIDSTSCALKPTSGYTIWTNADVYTGDGSHNVYYFV